jgi:hypothetical protein
MSKAHLNALAFIPRFEEALCPHEPPRVFRSVAELEIAIERFIAEANADPKPFLWTARPSRILAAVKRGK